MTLVCGLDQYEHTGTACGLTRVPLDDLWRLWRQGRNSSVREGKRPEETGEPRATTANNGDYKYKKHFHKGLRF